MVENKGQTVHKAGLGNSWSMCSYPSSQPRKVSIGITVERDARKGHGVLNEISARLPSRGTTSLCKGKVVKENKEQAIEENRAEEVNQAEDKDKVPSVWISPKSIRHETPTTESVQFNASKASIVQPKDSEHKKLDTNACGKRQEKGGNNRIMKEAILATMQEKQPVDKERFREEPEEVSKCNNENLKMKIWEILGTAPSQRKLNMDSQNIEEDKENLDVNRSMEQQRGKVAEPPIEYRRRKVAELKHNSDTIETDSESPNLTTKRRVTRSLTRKRAPPKTVRKLPGANNRVKNPLSSGSDSKLKILGKNIFAFNEVQREPGSSERSVGGCSDKIIGKRNEKKAGTELKKIYSRRLLVPQRSLQPKEREQTLPSLENSSILIKETRHSPGPLCQDKEDCIETVIRQKKARIEPHKKVAPRDSIQQRNLQTNEREESSGVKASLQSTETRNSSSPPCREVNDIMQQTSSFKKSEVQNMRIYSPRQLVPEKKFVPNEREKMLSSPDRKSVQREEVPNDRHHSQTDACGDFRNLTFGYNAEAHDTLPGNKGHSWENVMSQSQPLPKGSYLHDKVAGQSLERKTDPLDDFQSPTLAMNATPPSTSSSKPSYEVFSSPCGSVANIDDTEKMYDLLDKEFQRLKEEESGKGPSVSPMEYQETENFVANDFTSKGYGQTDKRFPDAGIPKSSSPSTLCQKKSLHNSASAIPCSGFRKDENWFVGYNSPMRSSFTLYQSKEMNNLKHVELRTEEITVEPKASDQYPESSLESDVIQLALVLERFKGKLKAHTGNKSSEILSASAEKIRLLLQDVESQMLEDIRKFSITGRSKRKRFETKLQGQQERLSIIHDKFKEEINQQLQDCRRTLEELEVQQTELKGRTDKQKASYRKLLLQVEESTKAELREAETRIAAIDKEARKKMYGLKHVLKEWMEDGVIR